MTTSIIKRAKKIKDQERGGDRDSPIGGVIAELELCFDDDADDGGCAVLVPLLLDAFLLGVAATEDKRKTRNPSVFNALDPQLGRTSTYKAS